MADDASKPKTPEPEAPAPARRVFHARPQPDIDPVKVARDVMDRHPIVMARLAE